MDLMKSILSFTVIACLTYLIVDDLQYQRDRERAQLVEAGLARRAAIDEFRSSSLRYQEAALDAFVDLYPLYRRQETNPSPTHEVKSTAMLRYEGIAYDDYLLSLEAVRAEFSGCVALEPLLVEMKALNDARHRIYDHLFDLKADGFISFEYNPSSKRAEFDQRHAAFSGKRRQALDQLGRCLAKSNGD
jgi:hypothetical protein